VKGDDLLIVNHYKNSCHNTRMIYKNVENSSALSTINLSVRSHETENHIGIRTGRQLPAKVF